MNPRKFFGVLCLGMLVWTHTSVLAQEADSGDSFLNIVSNPGGATVQLKGDYNLIVTTPASVYQRLNGEYKIGAFRRGYERWSSRVWFRQGNPRQLVIELKPKTRIKAGLRSLLIPGWGQFYCDEKTKSFMMGISTLGAVVAYVFVDNYYSNKYDDYNRANNELGSARNIEDWKKYRQLLDERQREAYDAENLRNVTLGIVVGAWAYNILDAVLFFPYGEEHFFAEGSKLTVELRENRPTLLLAKKF